jgi:hypothetical protein
MVPAMYDILHKKLKDGVKQGWIVYYKLLLGTKESKPGRLFYRILSIITSPKEEEEWSPTYWYLQDSRQFRSNAVLVYLPSK